MALYIALAMLGTLYHNFELYEMDILALCALWEVRVSMAIPCGVRSFCPRSLEQQTSFENDFSMFARFVRIALQ